MDRPASRTIDAVSEALVPLLGDRLDRSGPARAAHGQDEGWHAPVPPDLVAYPTSTEEVAAIVRICAEHRLPVIPYGAGTSFEGHIAALRGGLSLDLGRMDRILRVNADDLDCTVEAGVRRLALDERVRREGLFFPIDPGADASIGGMASTRASGTNAVRYGTMRENVLGLTAVLPDGRIVRTGTRARKSSAGYDLTHLLVGAEGTLGVITEVTLRLYGTPEVIGGATVSFPSIDAAVRTVITTIQLGVPVARIELLDPVMVDATNRFSGLDLPVRPLLLLEFHGGEVAVEDQAATVREVAAGHGGDDWRWSTQTEERLQLWKARHDALYAGMALRPGCRGIPTDVCVPISRLADCIDETVADIEATGLVAPIVGHVGDGNFHVLPVFDPGDPAELEGVLGFHRRLVARAQAMDGTCTGEHGIGYGKLEFMHAEHGEVALDMMRAVKAALDPHDLMNPGKVVPLRESVAGPA